jgi:hypothetical protein
MKRKTFDMLLSAGGMLVVVVLVVAGSLLAWGTHYIDTNVHNQLASQEIFFPKLGSPELASPKIGPYLDEYAGQQLTTGSQAEAWADHYIAVHLSEMPYKGVYSVVSAAALADPTNAALASESSLVFEGTTLRGLLLNAYAFGQMGQIAGIAALASFILAGIMLILAGFGLLHYRRVPAVVELLPTASSHAGVDPTDDTND